MTDLRIKPQSRSDLVVDRITNSIINGELTDGQLLPPESQLCEALGVSRSILREAVRVLSSKGLLEVRQGHGTFVRLPQIDVPEEAVRNFLMTNSFPLSRLMEVRTPIEIEIAILAARRRKEQHLEQMRASITSMQNQLQGSDAHADADALFHQAIIDASDNPLFGIMIRSIMVNLHISRELAIRHFGVRVVIEEHDAILKAIEAQNPEMAETAMKKHMDQAMDRINKVNELLK